MVRENAQVFVKGGLGKHPKDFVNVVHYLGDVPNREGMALVSITSTEYSLKNISGSEMVVSSVPRTTIQCMPKEDLQECSLEDLHQAVDVKERLVSSKNF